MTAFQLSTSSVQVQALARKISSAADSLQKYWPRIWRCQSHLKVMSERWGNTHIDLSKTEDRKLLAPCTIFNKIKYLLWATQFICSKFLSSQFTEVICFYWIWYKEPGVFCLSVSDRSVVWPLKCMLEGGLTQKELYQALHIPIRTIQKLVASEQKSGIHGEHGWSMAGGDCWSILYRTAKIVIAKNLGEKVSQPESSLEDWLQLAILHPTPPSTGTWRRIWMFWAENCCKTCPSQFFSRTALRLTQKKGPKNGVAATWPISGTKVHSQGTVWT